jgi:hypothetical protein
MTPRRKLSQLELTGGRAIFRAILRYGCVGAAALCALGYLLPAHRLSSDADFHSNFADGGPSPLLVTAGVAAINLWLRRARHGAGYVAGLGAMGGAIAAVVPVFLVHLFRNPELGVGDPIFGLGLFALLALGGLSLVAESALFLVERRHLECDVDPQFPSARVV